MLDKKSVEIIYSRPLKELIGDAAKIHAKNFSEDKIQLSQPLSDKNRRLPGKLRLLSPKRPLYDRNKPY